jgi:hypothetical protein
LFYTEATEINPYLAYPGWKTQFSVPQAGSTSKIDSVLFYGMGNCPCPTPVNSDEITMAQSPNDLVEFYLKVLRADCLEDRRAIISTRLLEEGMLKVEGQALRLNPDHATL